MSKTSLVPTLGRLVAAAAVLGSVQAAEFTTIGEFDDEAVIVISATRSETARDSVPTIVEVVEADDLRLEGHPVRTQDQLRTISGLTVQQNYGGFAGGGGIYVRGARAYQTQVMLDGIPFNDAASPQGTVGHHLFTLPGLGRIELAKGAQSGLYGSGATGGVLDLQSQRPAEALGGSARIEYGSFNTIAGEATASGPITEQLGFTAAVNGLVSDGFSAQSSYSADGDPKNFEDDGFQRLGFNGRLFFSTETVELSGGLLVLTGEEETDGYLAPDDEDSEVEFDSLRLSASSRVMVAERVDVAGDIAYSTYDRDHGAGSEYESNDIYLAGRGIFEVNEMVELTGAMDWRQQAAETSSIDDDADIIGTWGQATIAREALEAQVVLRHDLHSREGDATTWRLGASYGFLDDTAVVHAAYGTGFRAPSLFELYATDDYGSGPIGNEDLEPEETSTYELGHRSQLNEQVRLEQTVFMTVFEEAIRYVNGYENVSPEDTAYVAGIENTLVWRPVEQAVVRAVFTWQDSDDGGGDGNEMTFTPEITAGLEGTYEWAYDRHQFWATAGLDHRGKQWQTYDTVELDALTTLRLAVGYKPTKNVEVYLRGDNLTDEHAAVYVYEPTPPDFWYPGDPGSPGGSFTNAPLSLSLGVEATF